jgi:hypothetical protein
VEDAAGDVGTVELDINNDESSHHRQRQDDDPSAGIDSTVDQILNENATTAPEIEIKKPATLRKKKSSKKDVDGVNSMADVDDDDARAAKNITSYAE